MKSQVLHTVWCPISDKAAGEFEIWKRVGCDDPSEFLILTSLYSSSSSFTPDLKKVLKKVLPTL